MFQGLHEIAPQQTVLGFSASPPGIGGGAMTLGHWCCSEQVQLFVSPNIWRFPYCTWPLWRQHRVLLWWGWQEKKEKKQENEKFSFCINEKIGNVDFP